MNKPLIASILLGAVFVGGAIIFAQGRGGDAGNGDNVAIEAGTQVITINAKGGYAPKITTAKAEMPTILRVATNGTYDCSSAIRIPSLGYSKVLGPVEMTEITVPPQKAGSTLQGTCAMGMYNFSVKFL